MSGSCLSIDYDSYFFRGLPRGRFLVSDTSVSYADFAGVHTTV